jgi:hypothetical protein
MNIRLIPPLVFCLKRAGLNGMIRVMKIALYTLCIGLAMLAVGCQRPTWDIATSTPVLTVNKDAFDVGWDETLDVLRDHNFEPDRQDVRAGIITTHPTVSSQFFEFWRADAQGFYPWLESSLHTLRRWAEVRFVPADGSFTIEVIVHVERKSQPERQVSTSTGALQIFRENLPTYTGEKVSDKEAVHWVDLGTDRRLGKYLLEKICRRLPAQSAELISTGSAATGRKNLGADAKSG